MGGSVLAATTPNLNLKLLGVSHSDKARYFEQWRQDINGESGNSNMTKIDAAYGELASGKADKTDVITIEQIDTMFV